MQQPSKNTILPNDIKTLADWVATQFSPVDPIEVQNILPVPYSFKYCVNEDIEVPDELTRKVVKRDYEEKTLEPGETVVLMGGAAYIFVDGVARAYVVQKYDDKAAGDLPKLVEAADMAIIGKVGFAKRDASNVAPTMPSVSNTRTEPRNAPEDHNPNTVAPTDVPPVAGDTAFDGLDDDEPLNPHVDTDPEIPSEFELGEDKYDTLVNGRHRKNNNFITNEEFAEAGAKYQNATLAS